MPLIAGTVSEGMAIEFLTYCDIYKDLVTVEDVLANPTTAPIPKEPACKYALSGSLAHKINPENADKLNVYIMRMPFEFQLLCMRQVMAERPTALTPDQFRDWLKIISPVIQD